MIVFRIQKLVLALLVMFLIDLYDTSGAIANTITTNKKKLELSSFINNIGSTGIENYAVIRSSIVNQGDVYLDINPGKYLKPDGSFVFEVPKAFDQIYRYGRISGTNKDDVVFFDGKITVGVLDLKSGKNTLNIKAKSQITLDPSVSNGSSLNFYNIATFNIAEGVKIEKLNAIYGNYDITVNFNGPDSSNKDNDISVTQLGLVGSGGNTKGFINVNNAKVRVTGSAVLSSQDETITLKDATIDKDGKLDEKTVSILDLSLGLSVPGGNNTVNMGKFSQIKAEGSSIQLGGNNVVNVSVGASIKGNLLFRDGNNSINIASIGKEHYETDLYKIVIDSITFGNGQNNLNIGDFSNFKVNSGVVTGSGTSRIFVGKNSKFNVNGEVTLFGGFNHVQLEEGSETTANFKFSSVSSNNSFVVNTGDNQEVNLIGSITGSKNNDTFSLLGTGILHIKSPILGQGLDGFNNINLGQARVDFNKPYNQTNNANINISLLENDAQEKGPRMAFNALAQFNNSNLNIKYSGVTKNLGKVGDNYKITLFTVGAPGVGLFKEFSDVNLGSINFQSAIYKLEHKIVNDGLDLTLTKCSTFQDAVSGKNSCNTTEKASNEEYIVQIAGFLDQLVETKDLPQKYYNMLDEFAMMSLSQLEHTLTGFVPINNIVLFNINKNLADSFKEVTLNSKPYKINKNDVTLWSNYSYTKINLDDIKGAKGAVANGNVFMLGGEYSLFSFLKFGASIGYSAPDITGNQSIYKGSSTNMYYGIYGSSNITKNLTLNINLGVLSSNYELTRYANVNGGENISGKPKFTQSDLDALLSYKIRLGSFMVVPFASVGYTQATMKGYSESGFMAYKIEKSTFKIANGGLGVKALAVASLGSSVVIPSVTLAVNMGSQNSEATKAHLEEFSDIAVPISFRADNYGGITSSGNFSISYLLNNGISLDFHVGAKVGEKAKSLNLGATINITL